MYQGLGAKSSEICAPQTVRIGPRNRAFPLLKPCRFAPLVVRFRSPNRVALRVSASSERPIGPGDGWPVPSAPLLKPCDPVARSHCACS